MSALPTVANCQHACKRFALSIQLYCSTEYKTLDVVYEENITKARTLFLARNFDARNHNVSRLIS